jgi:hypothetical protein
MSKKKPRKGASKVTSPPPAPAEEGDATPAAPSNQSVESDAPPAPRRSTEADNEGGDVERLDNASGMA